MSILNRNKSATVQALAVQAISSIIAKNGASFTSPELADSAAALESIDDHAFTNLSGVITSVKNELEASPLGDVLSGYSAAQREMGLEAAALTILAGGNPGSNFAGATIKPQAIDGGVLVSPNQGGTDYNETYAMEAFDETSAQKYIAQTAYANALSVIAGGFEELFYPTVLVPAAQSGVDVKVIVPKIYPVVTRTKDGSVVPFEKKSMITALIDSSILDSDATDIVAYASDATNPAVLVTQAVVPDITKVVNGIDIATRPILFGTQVDLISLSSAPALLASGAYSETDNLDTVMNIGKVYYELKFTTGIGTVPVEAAVVLSVDVSNQIGSLFTQTADGSSRDYQANLLADVVITEASTAVLGDMPAMVTLLETALGLSVSDAFSIVSKFTASGTANTEFGTMEVFANKFVADSAKDVDGTISIAGLDTGTELLELTALGYLPEARRSNTNIATRGTIIDTNGSVTYRFPIPMGAPFVAQGAINGSKGAGVEFLSQANRIRNCNNAVKSLLNLESMLEANSGIPLNSPAMGAEMVTPTLVKPTAAINVATITDSLDSAKGLDNLHGALVAAIVNSVNELVTTSGYLAALEFESGRLDGYEVIVVTDTEIAPHLLREGPLKMPNGINIRISASHNADLAGKIRISVRTTDKTGLHPLNFGATLISPSLSFDAQVSRGNSTVAELHHTPRSISYSTLPLLAVLTVTNLDTIFVA